MVHSWPFYEIKDIEALLYLNSVKYYNYYYIHCIILFSVILVIRYSPNETSKLLQLLKIEIDIMESQMEKVLVIFRPKSADHSTFQQLRACSPRYKSARSLESQLVCLKSLILCALHQNDHVLIQANIL